MSNTSLTIVKPSFWSGKREIKDASEVSIGRYTPTSMWCNKAEGEIAGAFVRFSTKGWEGTRAIMSDMSGNALATIAPTSWWGMKYTLTHGEKEYVWKPNGWGTQFSVRYGEKALITVRPGGYFRPGSIELHETSDQKTLLPLALFGFFYMQVYTAHMAAAGGGGAS